MTNVPASGQEALSPTFTSSLAQRAGLASGTGPDAGCSGDNNVLSLLIPTELSLRMP
jgi:hypothetical protein